MKQLTIFDIIEQKNNNLNEWIEKMIWLAEEAYCWNKITEDEYYAILERFDYN